MNVVTIGLIIELLVMVGKVVPKLVPGIRDLLDVLQGEDVQDITHDELVARVKAAQAALP